MCCFVGCVEGGRCLDELKADCLKKGHRLRRWQWLCAFWMISACFIGPVMCHEVD